MAKLNLDRASLPALAERVRHLSAESPRQWGTLDAARMVRHLIFTLEMSLGVQKIEDKTVPVVRNAVYLVFFCWFTTWPKGKIKGPPFITPEPKGAFAAEQAELLKRMDQFVGDLEREPMRLAVNPGLGPIPLSKWSRVHGVHMDHHLRQFGA